METSIPAWGTPEYDMARLRHVVDTFPIAEGSAVYLTATVTFLGDGDTTNEADMFQQAANYFREHPEVCVAAANWSTYDEDNCHRMRLDLTVVPPAVLPR